MRILTGIFGTLTITACGSLGAVGTTQDDGVGHTPVLNHSADPSDTGTSAGTTPNVGTASPTMANTAGANTSGTVQSSDPGEPSAPPSVLPPPLAPLAQPLRRLSHYEYANTVKSLLPSVQVTLPTLATEETIDGFTNNSEAQQPSDLLVEQYFNVALLVAQALDDAQLQTLVGCTDGVACATTFITDFGKRAYRRPLASDEIAKHVEVFETGPGSTNFALGIKLTVMAFLQSPHFLYRPEFGIGEADPALGKHLAPYETASRLSYLLWSDMPDAALFDAAENGALDTPTGVEAEARRMLADPKAKEGVTQFFREWLKLAKLSKTLKLPEENWDDAFRAELTESVTRFTYDQVFAAGGSAKELLLATQFPMTSRVAELFGAATTGDSWEDIDTDPAQRSGLLTHPGILGAYGYGEYPSPVLRGVFVLDRFMCMPPTAPPNPAVAQPPAPGTMEDPRTNREAYVKVTTGNGCAACHTTINGIGFAFENYDTVGRYRTQDSGFDVDASGSIGSFTFDNAIEFSAQLADSKEYQSCVVAKWATYALGGGPLAKDTEFLAELGDTFESNDFSLQELLVAIATHERFSGWSAASDVTAQQ